MSKLGGGPGNGISATGDSTVVKLVFRLLREGATTLTIEGSAGKAATALDSNVEGIASVTFDSIASTLLGL